MFGNKLIFFLTPGRGIPNVLAQETRGSAARTEDFPSSSEAAQLYAGDMGSNLTADSIFGRDPFPSEGARNACQAAFLQQVSDYNTLLRHAVNGDFAPLQDALLTLIHLTRRHV